MCQLQGLSHLAGTSSEAAGQLVLVGIQLCRALLPLVLHMAARPKDSGWTQFAVMYIKLLLSAASSAPT